MGCLFSFMGRGGAGFPLAYVGGAAGEQSVRQKAKLVSVTEHVVLETSATGTKLVNQYEVLEKLGTGSYAKVRRCKDINSGATFAMKTFHRQALTKPRLNSERTTAYDDVLREISIMSKLHHPNIIRLVEVINDLEHDKLYLVMEYCENGPLMKKNMCDYHFETSAVKQYARDILEGVFYLHSNHIVHRDIKPENLLITADGVVKISDFGVSEEFLNDDDSLRSTAGTPSFTAPELIVAGVPAKGRNTDAFSVGVTLYCLCFSKTPFTGGTVMEVYDGIKACMVSFPQDTDPLLIELLSSLMAKDPDARMTIEQALKHAWLQGTVAR